MVVDALGSTIGVLSMRLCFSVAEWVWLNGFRCSLWRGYVSDLIVCGAVFLITLPLAKQPDRIRTLCAISALSLAAVSALAHLVSPFLTAFNLASWNSPLQVRIAVALTKWCLFPALSLAFAHLLLCIDRIRARAAWWVVLAGLGASIGLVLAQGVVAAADMPRSWQAYLNLAIWKRLLFGHALWLNRIAVPALQIAVLLSLCFVHKRLRDAPRAVF